MDRLSPSLHGGRLSRKPGQPSYKRRFTIIIIAYDRPPDNSARGGVTTMTHESRPVASRSLQHLKMQDYTSGIEDPPSVAPDIDLLANSWRETLVFSVIRSRQNPRLLPVWKSTEARGRGISAPVYQYRLPHSGVAQPFSKATSP